MKKKPPKINKETLKKAARIWVATLIHTSADMPSASGAELTNEQNEVISNEISLIMNRLNPDGYLAGNIDDAIREIQNTN